MADGIEVGRAHVTVTADGKPAIRQVEKDFRRGMPDVGKKAGGGIGAGMLVAARKFAGPVAALYAGLKLGSGLVGSASDLNETINKSTVIFGKNAAGIRKWSQNAETSLGLTDQQALAAAASFGDMFTQIGFTSKAAADMSKGVVHLSADLGSFNNLPTADVQERIAAAFRGEYDSLQKVIPNINAARVEQVALATTGKETAKQLTAQEKAAAVLAIVQKDGARASGDFARTQGEVANQTKIAKAQILGVGAQLGTALLPIVKQVFGFLTTTGIPALSRFVTFLTGLKGEGSIAAKVMDSQFGPALRGIVGAGQRLGAVVLPILKAIVAEFVRRWPVIKPVVMEIFRTIGGIVTDVMGYIKVTIDRVTKVIGFIWSRWGDRITAFASSDFRTILSVISGVMKVIGGVVKIITGVMTGDWRKAGQGIMQIVRGLRDVVVAIFANIALRVRTGVQALMTDLRGKFAAGVTAIGRAWDGLRAKAAAPIRFVVDTVINRGLIGSFNKLADIIPGVGRLPNVSAGFARGGWTGPGSKMQPAGIVHADEFVINKASRRRIEQEAPGLLDRLNGYAAGGFVGGSGRFSGLFASRLLAASRLAGTVFRIFQRGFRPPTSYSGTSHQGDAVDLAPITTAVLRALRSVGIAAWDRTGKGNWAPHIHGVPLPGSGFAAGSAVWQAQDYLRGGDGLGGRDNGPKVGVLARIGAFIKAGFSSFSDWFKSLIKAPLAKLGAITGSPMGRLAAGIPRMLSGGMLDKVKVFDSGRGFLDPGMNLAYNGTGRREWLGMPAVIELGPRSIAAIASALTVEIDGKQVARAVRYQGLRGTT